MSESPAGHIAATDSSPHSPALTFQNLTKQYGRVWALRGLNLQVGQGEVYGFLGRNGAGKSTAIRIAMGITKATAGGVKVFGKHLTANAVKTRQRIGYVAQEQNFYGWMTAASIGQFVSGFYPRWRDDEYSRLLKQLELPVDRKIKTFSGGMKAKLALAVALAHKPELLVLDEPTAGLDAIARREFIEMVREQAEQTNRTTFFSSHWIDEVETAADRVGIIEEGRAIYEGDLRSLSSRVRKLTGLVGAEVPEILLREEFQVLQDHTRRNVREIVVQTRVDDGFEHVTLPDSWQLKAMSLEDIFISMVSKALKVPTDASDPRATT